MTAVFNVVNDSRPFGYIPLKDISAEKRIETSSSFETIIQDPSKIKQVIIELLSNSKAEVLLADLIIDLRNNIRNDVFFSNIAMECLKHIPNNLFINYIVSVLEKDNSCFAFLLVVMEKKQAISALEKFSEKNIYPSNFAAYKSLIETLSSLKIYSQKMYLYSTIMDVFRKKDNLEHLYTALATFSLQSRSLLMKVMKSIEQIKIFDKRLTPQFFCNFLESLCLLNTGYQDLNRLISIAFITVKSDEHSTRQAKLHNIVLELGGRRSWLSAHLFSVLSFSEFQTILSMLEPKVCTDLFSSCKADDAISELLGALEIYSISSLMFLNSTLLFELNQASVGEIERTNSLTEPTTIQTFVNQLIDMPPEFHANYENAIKMIPPLLIAVACRFGGQINFFLSLIPHLTDLQILFLMRSIETDHIYDKLELARKDLRSHQFQMILSNLPLSHLTLYIKKKIKTLNVSLHDFRSDLQGFSAELKSFEQKAILKSRHEELYQKAIMFRGKGQSFIDRDTYTLSLFLYRSNYSSHKKLSDKLRIIINQFEEIYKHQLAPQRSLFLQLALMERNVINDGETSGIFERIYHEFWISMTEGVLVHLNISPNSSLKVNNAGELHLVGITSNEDLKLIGITKEGQIYLDQIILSINRMKSGDCKEQYQLSEKWKKFLDIKLNDLELKYALRELLGCLDIKNCDQDLLKRALRQACEQLLALDDLLDPLKKNIREILEDLDDFGGLALKPYAARTTARIALAIRRRQTLFKLQSYLRQPELKSCWDKLRANDFNCLTDLFKAKHITFRKDALQLQVIINTMGTQCQSTQLK